MCSLHDVAFEVTLPDLTLEKRRAQNVEQIRKSLFPQRPPYVEKPNEEIGTITETASLERQKALNRVRDWQLARIKGMRSAGLSTCDIAEQWVTASWTRYGIIRKPEGWRSVGESRVKKSEENKISSLEMQDYRVSGIKRVSEDIKVRECC